MEKFNCLSDFEYAYRKQCSTIEPIVKLSTFIQNALNNGEKVITVFFDLEKAFDRTW